MSIAARAFMDPRNTYIVDNNDPTAFDKSFAGITGTHPEQRCCGDWAPYWKTFSGLYVQVPDRPEAPYWKRIPEGGYAELWCHECSTALERGWSEFLGGLEFSLQQIAPALRAVAMVASYMPGAGTAVSVVINTSLTLAEGGSVEEAAVSALRGALPGQPASGAAFDAARSIVRGDSIGKIAIDGLIGGISNDPSVRKHIGTAIDIAKDVIDGKRIDTLALEKIKENLPDSAKGLLDVARSVAEGKDVEDIAIRAADAASGITGAGSLEAAQALRRAAEEARSKGQAAVDQFMAQVAFHGVLSQVPGAFREAVMAGLITGQTEKLQFIGTFGSVPEKNVPVNDSYFQTGQRLIDSGAKYKGNLISDILNGGVFTIDIDQLDALNGVWGKRTVTYKANGPWTSSERPLTDAWRRGFTIAFGVCDGSSERDPGQTAVYQTMAEAGGRAGFDAGQAVQFARTKAAANSIIDKLQAQEGFAAEQAAKTDRSVRDKLKKFGDQRTSARKKPH